MLNRKKTKFRLSQLVIMLMVLALFGSQSFAAGPIGSTGVASSQDNQEEQVMEMDGSTVSGNVYWPGMSGSMQWMNMLQGQFGLNQLGYVSVKLFGAKGNGVSDDTEAIQSAIDYVGEHGGGTVFFPAGTYIVKRATPAQNYNYCLMIKDSNISLLGAGMGATTIKIADGENATILRTVINNANIDGELAKPLKNIKIADLTIDGNWENITWAGPTGLESEGIYDQNGISIFTTTDGRVENVHVKHIGQDGLSGGSNRNIVVTGSVVEHTGKNNIAFFQSTGMKIVNNTARNANDSPDGGAAKPYYNTSSSKYSSIAFAYAPSPVFVGTTRSLNIASGNTIYTETGRGISADSGANNLIIANNMIESSSGRHLISLLMPSSIMPSGYVVSDNILRNDAVSNGDKRDISITNVQDAVVSGNTIFGGGLAIVLDNTHHAVVTDNLIREVGNDSATAAGINVRGSSNIRLHDNVLSDSTVKFTNQSSDEISLQSNKLTAAPTGLNLVDNLSSFNNDGYDPFDPQS
ncbi:glycosyl hydrolase family 28-related protein [Paenibacillus sp. J5C2022]|uniref:glycosyl hydrolase family 28-related protein n=1 Tax=Paenibacillus sp. J5C2022 TaxID=2977129 RepID=UPI0021D0245A|nr:glycosyl hydrolase family 28-related protein [Paenibacillus sp. J5C2022]